MHKTSGRNFFIYFVISLLLVLPCDFESSGQRSAVTEESRSILTYPFSDPNPVPTLAVNSMVSPFYPYFTFDGYTDKGVRKAWNVITLENGFINVTVLPEVGGKVWGAIEKSTGREFIYMNHVLKFRAIGIRGPWTSGGIEHNFGLDLGHAPWTASPVDYILKENPDGSVSCIVGGLDLASRTQWRVNIRLPKDKAYFETRSMWYNPTPLHDAYLSWENAGFRASDDLQFFFPGNYYLGHDGAVFPWPLDEQGRNLSFYRENNFGTSKSYHVSGLFTDWFGGYWHNADFGFGHWAPYADAPGKKIWIWSLARDGAIWEKLLTDTDGQYIEAQSGVKFNQASRESGYNSPYNQLSIRPYYTETKTESWFPVLKTGGMVDASSNGALNILTSPDSLKILISPNESLNDSLVILKNGKRIFSAYITLKPLQLYRKAIAMDSAENSKITVTVGKDLLSYNSDAESLSVDRPVKTVENTDYTSAEHLFLLAEDMNAMRDFSGALNCYMQCLQKEPGHSRALYKIAELHYRMALYQKGIEFAERVLELNTYDAGANFIYGLIHRKLGNLAKAEETFSVAARTMEYRSGSYLQIAGIRLQKEDFSGAIEYAGKALDYNRYNIPAREILATGHRRLNNIAESARILDELLEIDPLNHYARFEQYLLNPVPDNLENFKSNIRNELPHETYLELSIGYANQGLYAEAIRVLEESPSYPVVYYWLAYLNRYLAPEKSSKYLELADKMSPFLVFPFRQETIPVLTWALEQRDSWKARYYLGLIYWHIHRPEKAMELFEQCGDLPDYASFYLARGTLIHTFGKNDSCLQHDFKRAVMIGPSEWRTWHYLNNYLQSAGAFQDQLRNALAAYDLFPVNPVIGIDYVKALINNARYKECLKVLERINILPQEGAHEGHDLFEQANLSLAVDAMEKQKYRDAIKYINNSKNWPENLGAGKPYETDIRLQDFLSAFCYRNTGEINMADSYSNQIIQYSLKNWGGGWDPSNIYFANRALSETGQQQEALIAMKKWKAEQDSLRNWKISAGSSAKKVQWVYAKCLGEEATSEKIEKEISSDPAENRFRLIMRIISMVNLKKNEQ